MTGPRMPTPPPPPGFANPHPGDLLSALLDDELDDATAETVGAHLRGCADCRAELQLIEQSRRLLRTVPAEIPEGLVTGLVGRRLRASRRGLVVSAVAAAAALLTSVAVTEPADHGPVLVEPMPDDAAPGGRPYRIWQSAENGQADPTFVDRIEDAAEDLLGFLGG